MANSYRDPLYAKFDKSVEADLGLPRGMLSDIRTKGERSNANQVSEAGARSVYQIIPATRDAIKTRYGVDAYAGPEQAARAAGLILKENLQRNNGNRAAAVAEYHGGTDRSNWGQRTKAYVERVTGGGDPASAGGGSTYDRVTARQRANQGPSMAQVYTAYQNTGKAGGMTPQEAAQYEQAVLSGQVILPRGGSIRAKPPVPVLPASIVQAYNSHQMDDDPDARAEIKRAIDAGEYALPRGMTLLAPQARSAGERFGMGVRNVLEGAGGLVDIAAAPVNSAINLATGANLSTQPFRDVGSALSDTMGLAKPESGTEKLIGAGVEGGTQGLLTAGAGLPFAGASGTAGAVGRALTAAPVLDTVSGATAGLAQKSAEQDGAGPVGQFVAGLAGGLTPGGLAASAERIATRVSAPKTLPDVVAEVPRSAVIDETGNLTPDGQEIAARHGVSPEEVVAAYEAPPNVRTANDQMAPAVAREATNDLPVRAVEEAPPVRATGEQPAVAREPEAPQVPNMPDADQTPDLPATALARLQAGKEFGVDYSRGQATKSFDVQDAESRLRNSNGPQAEEMRQFIARQQDQVKQASEQFRSAFGDNTVTPEQRGEMVQDAVRELRDLGQKGVNELYKQARELGAPVDVDAQPIRNAFERVMVEADIPDSVKSVIKQEAARYGIIGEPVPVGKDGAVTSEAGITTVKLDDGEKVKFYGPPEKLRLDNADKFRTIVSKQYPSDGPLKLSQVLKKAIDDAVEETATRVATEGNPTVSAKLKEARQAVQTQKQTFNGKDIVQAIADWKRGAENVTGALKPEQVMQRALASTSDLKRVKAVLLSKATAKSKAAWTAIQAHGLATIFEKATTRTANAGGEIAEAISGAKLRSAIESFGSDKLRVLLDSDQFNQLMKLRRVIEDVTIPISGTTNPSGSGNLIMRLVKDVDNQATAAMSAAGFAVGGPVGAAIAGGAARMVSPAVKEAREAAKATETLKNAAEYTAEQAAKDDTVGTAPRSVAGKVADKAKAGAGKSVRAFIDTYRSPRILAPILASAGAQDE